MTKYVVMMVGLVGMASASAWAKGSSSYELRCTDVSWKGSVPQTKTIKETIKVRPITKSDVKAGLARKEDLGKSIGEIEAEIMGTKVSAKIYANSPYLEMNLANGTKIFDGHNDGRFAQLGAYPNGDSGLDSVSCIIEAN